jgi:minor extracellular serine protease Vpr
MLRNRLNGFVLLLALVLTTAYVVSIITVNAAGEGTSVIVQLRDDPAAVYKTKTEKAGGTVTSEQLQAYREQLRVKQDQFLEALRNAGVPFQVDAVNVPDFTGGLAGRVDFRYTLVLNAIALKVEPSALSAIKSMPQVKSVNANHPMRIALEKSVDYINAPAGYGQYPELTPFDQFREGYEGQGINIAVLDTGIDWTHPMFGGDPTPPRLGLAPAVAALSTNQKVIYYMSFTAGLLDDFGHGSAAASNAAGYLGMAPGPDKLPGTADDVRLHGVAPQARLMGYKVCASTGHCLPTSTIMAIEDAVSPVSLDLQPKPIAHVINLSLGGPGGPDNDTAVAASNAALLGTIVVASAGNEGPGQSTVGSPAAGVHVIAVGANNDPASGSNTADLIGGRTGMIANLLDGAAPITLDITQNYVYCGLAETPADVPDSVAGKIALIARGSTVNFGEPVNAGTGLFSNKAANAFAKGAIAVVIYNNVDGELSAATVRASLIPVVGISKLNGEYLRAQLGSEEVGAVSASQLRLNRALLFQPQMTDFSSRGPLAGLGQVKPDVTAPGLNIYSATVRVGTADINTSTMFDPTGYIHATGTSFSGPHVAGAVALIKQAHLNFTPDMIRTVLMNTSTNLRNAQGVPRGDGDASEPVNAQGAGLINVKAAIDARAIMGIVGDGIEQPSILGSYSFGEAPVLNNRIMNTRTVTVTIRDTSGQGGTYNLSAVGNRNFNVNGITASVSPSSVTVPANGTKTFTASVKLDGDKVRDTSAPKELQWYVVAKRSSGNETLRMPMFWRTTPTLPADGIASSATESFSGTVLASDGGVQRDYLGDYVAADITYVDVPFEVGNASLGIDANLDFQSTHIADIPGVGSLGIPDLDFLLFDPDGNEIGSSANGGGPEHISASVTRAGTYTYRVYGWLNPPTDFTITSTQLLGGGPPTVNPFAADFVDANQNRIDFDGSYILTWQPAEGNVLKYEVEESVNGAAYSVVRTTNSNVYTVSFNGIADSTRSYRVRAIFPGRIGMFVTIPSNVETLIIDRRCKVNITKTTQSAISSVSFTGGVFQINLDLTNGASSNYHPLVDLKIVRISSASGTVSVINSDNGGNGSSHSNGALFGYSNLLGTDEIFSTGEKSGARTIQFRDTAAELFTFDAVVTAYKRKGQQTSAGAGSTGGSDEPGSGNPGGSPLPIDLVRFTVNPLTRVVSVQLIQQLVQ